MDNSNEPTDKPPEPFKKPLLVGKIGKLPKKFQHQKTEEKENTIATEVTTESTPETEAKPVSGPTPKPESNVLPYIEPAWSGLPQTTSKKYSFDVLKNGLIIETIDLMSKPFWVLGRLNTCDIFTQHPTISRYHAVLQFRTKNTEKHKSGFYVYDLGSTHGTFLNKNKLKPKMYAPIQVGHMLKLGCSTRTYILNGPEEDQEEESELSVTELKQKRAEELRAREEEEREAALKAEKELEARRKREEERGVDWGLGEDAEEETDLSDNPFAQTNNEELYLDDPKKALRGFFEREGLDLEYDCKEQGMGQFLCKVELPLDDEFGRSIVAEVLHKGKKKEAVIQCALEACRILDRHGVLRKATHESHKRKAKNWEENDYYDSDEDTFLDRTGTVEKKREMRMKGKVAEKVETYDTLVVKESEIRKELNRLENDLQKAQLLINKSESSNGDEDSLDSFMKELKESKPDKQSINKLKTEISKKKAELANIVRLVNLVKPTDLPALVPQTSSTPSTSQGSSKAFPVFGKRKKLKVQLPEKPQTITAEDDNDDEEQESDQPPSTEEQNGRTEEETEPVETNDDSDQDKSLTFKAMQSSLPLKRFKSILAKGLPPFIDEQGEKRDQLQKILNNLQKLASNEDRMHAEWKTLAAKKRKVMKLIDDLQHCESNEKLERRISMELNRILAELTAMTDQKCKDIGKVKKMGHEIKNISDAIGKDFVRYKEDLNRSESGAGCSTSKGDSSEEENDDERSDLKKKKRNQRRIMQRQEKAEIEKQRGYEEDASREDYNMWVPPQDQSGDGRTSLNDKLGY